MFGFGTMFCQGRGMDLFNPHVGFIFFKSSVEKSTSLTYIANIARTRDVVDSLSCFGSIRSFTDFNLCLIVSKGLNEVVILFFLRILEILSVTLGCKVSRLLCHKFGYCGRQSNLWMLHGYKNVHYWPYLKPY